MSILKKAGDNPFVSKFMINHYAPYRGAGIEIDKIDLPNYHIRVKMALTRKNQEYCRCSFWWKSILND